MRVYIEFGYSFRGVADITPAELEVLARALDKVRATDSYYGGGDDIVCRDEEKLGYTLRVVSANTRLVQPPVTPATEASNG